MKKTVVLLTLFFSFFSQALTLTATKGQVAAQPIAIVPFQNNVSADKIDVIISSDLKQSGVFAPVNPNSYSQRPTAPQQINFANWTSRNIPYVVVGRVNGTGVEFAIADTFRRKVIGVYQVTVPSGNARLAAHKVADGILKQLTGVRGAFATRLVYVNESGEGINRHYRLMLSDADGKNSKRLLLSRKAIVSPRFSPDGQRLVYVTYESGVPEIVTHNVMTGRRTLVSDDSGISSPTWSPKGDKIAYVSSKDGNPEIYIKHLASGKVTRVTNNKAIDTEPAWSRGGGILFFTSDRSGAPHLHQIMLRSGKVKKVSYFGNSNGSGAVSPDGKKLAIATNQNGRYQIGIMDLTNGRLKVISNGAFEDTPRFSPNGQMLIFTTMQDGRETLKVVNVDGSGETILSSPSKIRDPDWSTFLN